MAILGHKIKRVVLSDHTLIAGQHCDCAVPLELIESDAIRIRNDGRVHRLPDGQFAIFDTQKEADDLIKALGRKPEVYEADAIAARRAAEAAKLEAETEAIKGTTQKR